jgi:hypothetical protein
MAELSLLLTGLSLYVDVKAFHAVGRAGLVNVRTVHLADGAVPVDSRVVFIVG